MVVKGFSGVVRGVAGGPQDTTPKLPPGLQPPSGAGSQPDQAWAEDIAVAIAFEDEAAVAGFGGWDGFIFDLG